MASLLGVSSWVMPACARGTASITTRKGQLPRRVSQASAGKSLPLCQMDECFPYFSQKEKGCMTKVNITIFSYYRDLSVHMSSRRSLIGRLQGPQREMTERAPEKWVSAAIPGSSLRGRSKYISGGRQSTFKLFINLIPANEIQRGGDDLQLHMIWVSRCGKWLPRVLETRSMSPLAIFIQRQQYCNLQWLWLQWVTWSRLAT